MVRVSRPHDLQMEDGRGRNGQFRGGMSRVGGAAGLGEPLARELILRGGRLLEPVVTHTAQDRGRLGEQRRHVAAAFLKSGGQKP